MAQFHLADLFETVAAAVPERVAILSDALTLTYAELNARADRVAAGLCERGVRRGDTVSIYMMNAPEHLETFLAVIKLGAVPGNVNYRYRADELRYLFRNADTAAIVHGAAFSDMIRSVRDDLPVLKLTVAVEDGSSADISGSVPYTDLLDANAAGPFERSENDIILTYTGGTTGMPKGVMWPHKAYFYACLGGGGHFHPAGPIGQPGDIAARASEGYPLRMFTTAPLMHAAAVWAAWSALLGGLTIVLDPRQFDAVHVWDRVERDGVNLVQIVGDAMAIPLRDALRDSPGRWSLGHVVNFGSGGAVFSSHVKDDIQAMLPSVRITDGMGASETGMSGIAETCSDGIMRIPATGNQWIIVDDRLAAVGETGFIARSGHIPVGYYNDPEKTADVFRTIGGKLWAVSGDSGRLDAGNKITVFGRGSTCINSGGEKIYPEEVEEALRSHPAIFDAVVVGKADERWGESVVGVISLRAGCDDPGVEGVRTLLGDRLAAYKLPKAIVVVDAVMRSPAGKQDYRWAKEMARA